MSARGCLGDDTIAAMLDGGLATEHAQLARAHIVECDECRRLVSAAIAIDSPAVAAPADPPGAVIAPGTTLAGSYRIEQLIAEGGMGRLYRAVQLRLDRRVAIKVMRPDLTRSPQAMVRFHREARLVGALRSQHVVRVHDFGTTEVGEPYLVMELLDGYDLQQYVHGHGPVAAMQATAWLLEACDAMGEAHALGIVHRDIKPSNLFVTPARGLVVLDFGLAKLAASNITAAGMLLGAPRFIAPEQLREARDVDARTDVWALGAVLYFLLVGRSPYDTPTAPAEFAAIARGELTLSLEGIPPAIAAIVARALDRDPAARFADAAELSAALRTPAIPAGLDARFEVFELIGQGAHGEVYRARPRPSGRDVALKVLRDPFGAVRERFAREAALVQRLEHPNSVRLLDAGVADDGTRFMAFELVRGRTLAAELAGGPLMPARVSRIAVQVLKALVEAHAHGIVHRDVTPANILLVDYVGDPDFVKLLDFGVAAHAASPRLTSTGQMIGTPRYMAPEQVMATPVDARADLYALGLVLAEALTGVPVFADDNALATCVRQAAPDPVPLPPAVVTGPLGDVIVCATAKQPEHRFATAADMLAMVERGPVGSARIAPPAPVPVVVAHKRAAVPIAIALSAVVAFAVAAAMWPAGPDVPAVRPVIGSDGRSIPHRVDPAPVTRRPPPTGELANVDEPGLLARAQKLGWTIRDVSYDRFPGCDHMRIQLVRGERMDQTYLWADVYVQDCESAAEAARANGLWQRVDHGDWSVVDGPRILNVATPADGELFASKDASMKLGKALLAP